MARPDSKRTAERKTSDLARAARRRERYAPSTLDIPALQREADAGRLTVVAVTR